MNPWNRNELKVQKIIKEAVLPHDYKQIMKKEKKNKKKSAHIHWGVSDELRFLKPWTKGRRKSTLTMDECDCHRL